MRHAKTNIQLLQDLPKHRKSPQINP